MTQVNGKSTARLFNGYSMIDSDLILGVIPARGGSKGVPGKNIRLMGGRPLIEYTIEAALQSEYIDRLIVSTDSEEIANVARDAGADVPFIRPADLATDTAKALGVMQHAISSMERLDKKTYPIVVYLEPPNPLRLPVDIDACVELMSEYQPDSVVSVQQANQFHPILMKKIEDGRLKPIWKNEPEGIPRQLYEPAAYMRNGAVYVFRKSLLVNGIMYGNDIVPYVMPEERSVCIDDMNDWFVAESWLNRRQRDS